MQSIDITDISFDSRESLYFGVNLPENGILFGVPEYQTPYFVSTLRDLARFCRFPWVVPDVNVTGQMELDELNKFDSWFNINDKLTIVDPKDFWKE